MAVPATRDDFKSFCLRKLGAPVIDINVDDDQLDDRVDEALSYYADYHFDGSHKIYYKYQVTAQTKIDRYVPMPENVIGVINLFPIGQALNTNNLFNIRYQLHLNELFNISSVSVTPYVVAMRHIEQYEQPESQRDRYGEAMWYF